TELDNINKARPTTKEAPTGQCHPCKKKHQPARKAPNRAKQQLDDTNDARHQSTEQNTPNSEKERIPTDERSIELDDTNDEPTTLKENKYEC
ncbi:7786_t:CDS:1, partial [Racocetra persica]